VGTMSRVGRAVTRNSAAGLAAQVGIKLLGFGFSVLIVRTLGAEAFGQYATVLAFTGLFVVFADLGVSQYAVRNYASWRDASDAYQRVTALYGNVVAVRLLLAITVALVMIASVWLAGRPLPMVGAVALAALGLVIWSLQGATETVLTGFERLDVAAVNKVANQLVFVFAGSLALWLGAGYYGLLLANLLAIVATTWLCWRAVRRLGIWPARPVVREWPNLIRTSLPFGMIGLALGLSYKLDSVLLNTFRGDVETGYYNAAYNLIFSVVVLSNVFNLALYPSLTRQAAVDRSSLVHIYARALQYLMVLALPIAAGTWVLAEPLVHFLFTPAYSPAIPVLQIIIWVVPLMFASEFLGYVALVDGHEGHAARAVLLGTGFNVALNLLFVPRYGLYAASVMTVLTEALLVGQYVWLLGPTLRRLSWGQILVRPLMATLAMSMIVLALRDLPVILCIAVGAVVYGVLLVALGVLGKDELRFVEALRQPTASLAVAPAASKSE
jgi:O-antigen/teichoic acid export membrane protein